MRALIAGVAFQMVVFLLKVLAGFINSKEAITNAVVDIEKANLFVISCMSLISLTIVH
jgi:hypothetical protein